MADDVQEQTTTQPNGEAAEVVPRLEAEVAELRERLLRTLADRENDRRRAARDRDEAVRFAAAQVVNDLLSSIDSLRQAIQSVPSERAEDALLSNMLAGIEATERSLLDAFARHGIARVEPASGESFDPNRHHAIAEVDSPEGEPGTIVQVLRPGYVYHERLLRPALVSVARAPSEAPQSE